MIGLTSRLAQPFCRALRARCGHLLSRRRKESYGAPSGAGTVVLPTGLSPEANLILEEPNAGGSSVRSEAYAMEILKRYYGAVGVTTEMAITYDHPGWKKCDFLTRFPGAGQVGVSVTRALITRTRRPSNPDHLDRDLSLLIHKKLHGLIVSRAGVTNRHAFTRSLLFVWSPDRVTSRVFQHLYHTVDSSLTDDVQLVIVETDETSLRTDFQAGCGPMTLFV